MTKTTEAFEAVAETVAVKGKKLLGDVTQFSKENMGAFVEAGKIAAKGAQELGQANVEFAKTNMAEAQSAVKAFTAVKDPTEFMKLQGEFVAKGFDVAVAQASKNTEAFVKLAGEIFQPVSNRLAVAADLVKKAA